MAKKLVKFGYEVGETVYVFDPNTKRFQKRTVEAPYSPLGRTDHVMLQILPGGCRSVYADHEIGRTKKEALENYYMYALEKAEHWNKRVEWIERKIKRGVK